MWFDEGAFYQIYPLGFCGAERENDFGEIRHRLGLIEAEIPRLKELGVKAVMFNPLFESERHGYDTIDFFKVDRRLGTNEELKNLVAAFHAAGIRVVLDGVFHHTGRAFAPFREVLQKREDTDYRFWFNIDFYADSPYHDGLNYDNWEGHAELVRLRLENCDLQNYLMDAVRYWIREFGIDGLRLDVSYSLPVWFLEMLRRTVRELKEDFFLVGEVIHIGNSMERISPERLNSVTNYECYKGLVSAFNCDNLFEIEHSLTRLFSNQTWSLYTGKNLLSFADNHDVPRVATALRDGRKMLALYTVLFTMPGIPCLYYGSEYGARGDKGDADVHLRPAMSEIDRSANPELYERLKKLYRIRGEHRALAYGCYEKRTLQNKFFCFRREGCGETLFTAANIGESDCTVYADGGEGVDLLTGESYALGEIRLKPFEAKIILKT